MKLLGLLTLFLGFNAESVFYVMIGFLMIAGTIYLEKK
jgi:hypothetical protein